MLKKKYQNEMHDKSGKDDRLIFTIWYYQFNVSRKPPLAINRLGSETNDEKQESSSNICLGNFLGILRSRRLIFQGRLMAVNHH